MGDSKQVSDWKQKVLREVVKYWMTFLYLAVFFGAFTTYQRLILAQYEISYVHYGVALIEALILAKVILIGDALRLGRRVEDMPLMYPTLYKTLIFAAFVAFFKLIEHTISGLLHGQGITGGFSEIEQEGTDAFFAKCVIVFTVFIPFFAFKELGRVLGEGKISELFFRRKAVASSGDSGSSYPEGTTPGRAF